MSAPVLTERYRLLVATLAGPGGPASRSRAAALVGADPERIWLALSVLTGELPLAEQVVRLRRRSELDGPEAALRAIEQLVPRGDRRAVSVVSGEVLVDVNQLARTTLLTGIQRVAYETVSRWHRDHRIRLVVWNPDNRSVRLTTDAETRRTVSRDARTAPDPSAAAPESVVVPWECHWVLPEVALELDRTKRIRALATYARCAGAAIGFDTVPLTSAETTDTNVPGYFVHELAAIRHMGRVSTISEAARGEYEGWRTMITSLGATGPVVRTAMLPVEAPAPSEEALAAARVRYTTPTLPLVLVVGSHEPRKNHVTVLTTAELLWREGHEFSLLFVGGNAWRSEIFETTLARLAAAGHPVETVRGLDDDTLWALYRLARFTVFPSLNEGFGLPVAESLASGTPVVTSGFGSMAEIAADGGALLVDPRDDGSVIDAVRTLLVDDDVLARLRAEAAARPTRTWEDYAAETWEHLVATHPLGS